MRVTGRHIYLPVGFPVVVALCGSTRFGAAFANAQNEETLAGRIVLTIGSNTQSDDELFGHLPPEEFAAIKARLDTLHRHKIRLADEILVVDTPRLGGLSYIGSSTKSEIEYARSLGKRVRYLSLEWGTVQQ